jgi:hypothetical protein
MFRNANPPARGDHLAEMLSRGEAPSLDELLALCPDEPLAEPEPGESMKMAQVRSVGWVPVPRTLPKASRGLAEKYPGLQVSYRKREHMKYGNTPKDGAALSEYVRARISHAKALWCRDIETRMTREQFRDWLKLHVNGETWIPPLWPEMFGWSEALQVLRIACGFPRFDPTITWELRPPRRSPR